ncbi:uncharacterized protein LOC143350575 [Colletes latitarsis]|uniref:uncharacterized protein LOC143350575 n=1 Tax=Colletes latitarsis TaxID=2605962 RepID=UPI004036593D
MTSIPYCVGSGRLRRSPVYLPHHAVVHEQTSKLRIVFNASAVTSNGTSLNDHLLIWKITRTNASCGLANQHKNRAPFLAQRVLRQLADDDGDFVPRGRLGLTHNFYVDDVIFGADTLAKAIATRHDLTSLLAKGGFSLGKWAATEAAALPEGALPENSLPLGSEDEPFHSVLGLQWNPENDVFAYRVDKPCAATPTKRSVLSMTAWLFDPLGCVSPVIIVPKIILQSLWIRGVDWDTPLPPEFLQEWCRYAAELHLLRHVRVPRWCGLPPGNMALELHGFADASSHAYAEVVYARLASEGGAAILVTLLVAKTRVAPVKTLSIPRLELYAAVLLTRLLARIHAETPFVRASIFALMDSRVVLEWLRRHPATWQVFVANRVSEIQTAHPSASWQQHVPTRDNPADCASRGMLPEAFLAHTLWWHGPGWLWSPRSDWPAQDDASPTVAPEIKVRAVCIA